MVLVQGVRAARVAPLGTCSPAGVVPREEAASPPTDMCGDGSVQSTISRGIASGEHIRPGHKSAKAPRVPLRTQIGVPDAAEAEAPLRADEALLLRKAADKAKKSG